jgi:hypothetical protein
MKVNLEDYQKLKSMEEGLWQTEYQFDRAWMENVLAPNFFEYGMSSHIYQLTKIRVWCESV